MLRCRDCKQSDAFGHLPECRLKNTVRSYCIWCEEKLATLSDFPHCSRFCKAVEKKAEK